MIERLYVFLLKTRGKINEITILYILYVITGVFSSGYYENFNELLFELKPSRSFTIFLAYLSIVMIIVVNLSTYILKKIVINRSIPHKLASFMDNYSDDECFKNIGLQGGYYWGADRTILVCDNIFEGWHPEDIIIDRVMTEEFIFEDNEQLLNAYNQYMQSNEAKTIVKKKNNNVRWMINNFDTNSSKTNKQIYLQLQKTSWCMNQFTWNYFKEFPNQKRRKIEDLYRGWGYIYPNSFCLHLIIMTSDSEVLLTRISNNKRNDYPKTITASIGEQIEKIDFQDGATFSTNLMYNWVERAIKEELGLDSSGYKQLVNERTIRSLAITVEGDIYNLALISTVNLHCTLPVLLDYMKKTPVSDKEIAEIIPLKLKDIPSFMAQALNNQEDYHPSTFLRLFLCYIHQYGVTKFVKEFNKQ